MFEKTEEQKRKLIEENLRKALEEKAKIDEADAVEAKRKRDLKQKRDHIELAFKTRERMYGISRPGGVRFLLYLLHVQKNPDAILDSRIATAYGVTQLLQKLNELSSPPETCQKFNDQNEPVD